MKIKIIILSIIATDPTAAITVNVLGYPNTGTSITVESGSAYFYP